MRTVPVSCNLDCGGACPLLAHVRGDRLVRITNNPLGMPHLAGCIRGFRAGEALHSSQRLVKPLLQTGERGSGGFKQIDWSDALDIAAERLTGIKARYGNAAIMALGGSGSTRGALHNTRTLNRRFLSLFGGFTELTGSYSAGAVKYTAPFLLGTLMAGSDPQTLADTRFIILWGANVAECRFGPELGYRIREAKKRGVEVVVIDPRRSATVDAMGTEWIPVFPGTDVALMMGVMYVLITEELIDTAYIDRYSIGFDPLKAHILGTDGPGEAPKTPLWAEKICGTPAETIRDLARRYARSRPAALIPGLSIQRTLGGEEAVRMAIALQTVTGNLGVKGGFSGYRASHGLPHPSVGTLEIPPNPVDARVPVYHWADAILEGTGGGWPGDIKAVYNIGGNYLNQGSDVRKNIRALGKVEFSVCHDYFLTPTAKYCDLVFPAATFLERNDIVLPVGGNYLLFSNRIAPPRGESRTDYDILAALAQRLGVESGFTEQRDEAGWLNHFIQRSGIPDAEEFMRTGLYMAPEQQRVGLAEFIADPETHPLDTPSGRIELSSDAFARTGFSPVPACRVLPTADDYPLRLITPKSRYRIHSQNFNLAWAQSMESQDLWIHPRDASERNITAGDRVLIHSREGRVMIPAKVTDRIMPGVVCLLQGAWPSFDRDGVDTAGSANVLTSTESTLPSRSSRTHSILVQVTPV